MFLSILPDMSKSNTHGGVRPGQGRKPIDDKLKPVTVYVRESVIRSHGIETVKEAAKAGIIALS